jgi:hypothetical protein
MTTLSERSKGAVMVSEGSAGSRAQPLAERRDLAEQYLITASANITDALLVLMDTPFEEEVRSYLMDLYSLEERVRG